VTKQREESFGWLRSIQEQIVMAARQQFDYPAVTAEKLDRDFQKLFKFFKSISQNAHEKKMFSYAMNEDLEFFESTRANETISDHLVRLRFTIAETATHQDELSSLLRKTARLRTQLRALKLSVEVLANAPVMGLATLIKRAEQLEEQLLALNAAANSHSAQLFQFAELASWNARVVLPKTQIASGFSEIGVKALFEVAYGVDAPRVTRRTALAALSKWAASIELEELSEIFSAHREFASTKRTLEKVSNLNFINYEHHRKTSGKHQLGEEYLVLLESLRIDAGTQAADNLLWVANFVGKLEAKVLGDSAANTVHLDWLNLSIKASGYTPIEIIQGEGPVLDRIAMNAAPSQVAKSLPLVSVILPAFNSEKWISTAIQSLLAQTWTALEIIVVDDCSTDSTYAIAKSFEALDHRVRVLRAKSNSGPYHCRNLALKQAKGAYVTVHDADDWSHPQKIEIQVRHLESNSTVMANVSKGARVDEATLITGLAGRTQILRPNFSSLMFRREPVTEVLGFWDEVRFGADSEFQCRLIGYFGDEAFAIIDSGLLSLLRVVEGSLTAGGMQEMLSGPRLLYKESFQEWHRHLADSGESYYLDPSNVRRFYAPRASLNNKTAAETRDLLVVADFSEDLSKVQPLMAIIDEAISNNLAVSITHVPSLERPTSGPSSEVETLALAKDIEMTWHSVRETGKQEPVCTSHVLVTKSVVSVKYDRLPNIEAQEHVLLLDGKDDTDADAELRAKLVGNYLSMFGSQPRIAAFGEESVTIIRDLKWLADIASGTELDAKDNKRNSKSEL